MKAGRPMLSEQLRRAIRDSELSRYQISKATGVGQSTLSLFCAGKRGLSMDAIDRLVDFLGWQLGPVQPARNKR